MHRYYSVWLPLATQVVDGREIVSKFSSKIVVVFEMQIYKLALTHVCIACVLTGVDGASQ